PASVTGRLDVRFVNDTGEPLGELYLRLYPNLRQYGAGGMTVWDVTVDGVPVAPEPPPLHSVPGATPAAAPDPGSGDLVLLRLPLVAAIPPGGAATVTMAFTTTVPLATSDGPGLLAVTPETGTWALAHWFPILAGYDPSSGWELEPPSAWSDPVFATTALFDVTLAAPRDLVLVTTGVLVADSAQEEEQVRRFVSGPARDFTVVADDDFASASTLVGDTVVTSYYNPEDAAGGSQVLEWAAQSLAVYTELFGPYPYAALDLVAVPGVTGFEFPQLVFVGAGFYADPDGSGSRPGAIEFLVAHEVSHQWWYGLVGNNPHRHAFLDEGLAEYSAVLYVEAQHGARAATEQLDRGLTLRYATMLLTVGDQPVDQPTVGFPDSDAYYATVYRKAGLGFAALRGEIGDEAFFAGLQDYAAALRFGVATPDDLRAAFERAAGRDLGAFWRLWFEAANGRVEIVMEPDAATPSPTTPDASPLAGPETATPGALR
ncbi:MAG: M1 family metallopeptidase, partial [Propionibacteriaceae bacterium]|nr:M1 family metallopeptidase [Propionibacteriaceae bacterium]